VYSGKGPNHTISHVLAQSGIIELYRSCHENVEDNFNISQCTVKHADVIMDADITVLRDNIAQQRVHTFIAGREAAAVTDQLEHGIDLLQKLDGWLVSVSAEQEADDVDQDIDAYEVEDTDFVN